MELSKISKQAIFVIFIVWEGITFAMAREGVLGELFRDPYNASIDIWLVLGAVPLAIASLIALYAIVFVWVVRPIRKLFK